MGRGKSSRAETFLLILKQNLKRCLPKPSKPLCNSQFEWHLRGWSSKVDTERICLESRGWLPVPRWTAATSTGAMGESATREGAGGSIHSRTWMGTFLYE